METWLTQHFELIVALIFLVLGYMLGRNSANQPIKAGEKEIKYKPGSNEEPDGDLFNDAMMDEGEERVSTL